MTEKNNVHAIPNKAHDEIEAAMAQIIRMAPRVAEVGKTLQKEFIAAGFSEDEALKLVAYAIFK